MLTQALELDDLQTEKKTFDGTMVYAQQKRQQGAVFTFDSAALMMLSSFGTWFS